MAARLRQTGTTLTAAAVGLAVGAITVVAILAGFAAAEALKRSAAGIAEAQHAGAVAAHALATELANAGAGYASALRELATCADTGDFRTSLRPVPVLITPGASAADSDSLAVGAGGGGALAGALALAAAPGDGLALRLRAPLGVAVGDAVALVGLDGRCALTTLAAVSGPDPDGVTDALHTGLGSEFPATSMAIDLGPRSRWRRLRYDIAEGSLRSLDLAASAASPNPLLSNAVLLRAQYGVDTDGDGALDAWVGAGAAPWTPAAVLGASADALASIKAVRFGLIVRSDVPDRSITAAFRWTLFDCGDEIAAACPERLTGTLPAGWRYRVQERVVPLRNAIWAAGP